MSRNRLCNASVIAAVLPMAGCSGQRIGVLAPAGVEAEATAQLFVVMASGAVLVWATVVGIALYAMLRPRPHGERTGRWLILGGGVIVPTVVLGALLFRGLVMMSPLREPGSREGARVEVSGEQWWWRVRYVGFGDASPVTLANEVRLPVGERTTFVLDSPDVIHAFWVPELAGKVDMIPGRTNTLVLEPTRTGVFRGVCAEYCGTSHAYMQFVAVVTTREEFDAWLRQQAAPARAPWSAQAQQGHDAFLRNGCGACHAIRGTPARGTSGPDLTHVGSRHLLGAGAERNDADGFRRWTAKTHELKPEALMPSFGMLPDSELQAMALYLDGLQ